MNKMKDDGYNEAINDILLFGGNAMIENIDTRFKKEMKRMDKDVNIITSKKIMPEFYAWNGASKLLSLSSFSNFWVTKQEYDEEGQNAVHYKCDECSIWDWN